jgi:bifunctional DNA-binding transcriptional regulator/antitoxin component of YhaV-PrlF toxin-antitoxin module
MTGTIVTVTSKGQATLPKSLREKHKIGKKVYVVDTGQGILFKPIADLMTEKGSLRTLFKGKTSRQLINEARSVEAKNENRLYRASKR